jgi:hypothetical protein
MGYDFVFEIRHGFGVGREKIRLLYDDFMIRMI